jgi:type II secretory pathway component PulF
MILVRSILAGLVALAGITILLALFVLLFTHVVGPVLSQIFVGFGIDLPILVGIRVRLMPGGYVLAGIMAAAILFLGFRWEYRRMKARQTN